jgi:hypothetical protein
MVRRRLPSGSVSQECQVMTQAKKIVVPEKLYSQMTGREKLSFIGKACVFFASGGFIFPTIWID